MGARGDVGEERKERDRGEGGRREKREPEDADHDGTASYITPVFLLF